MNEDGLGVTTTSSTKERDLTFLLEATRLLAASLDVEATLRQVARLSLPHLGSWCIVDLREGDHMRRLAIVHPDPEMQLLAEQLMEGWPPIREDPLGMPCVMRTGRSEVVYPVTDEMLRKAARSKENLEILRALEIGSFMTIPIATHGDILGAITYVSANQGDHFTSFDLVLGEDLATRAAIAIDHARLMNRSEELLAAARLSEERFAGLISIAAEAIISTDDSQNITLFNEGAENIFGYSTEEILGQPLSVLLPIRARGVHEAHVEAFGKSADVTRRMGHRHDISGRRKDGEEFPAEASISKLELHGKRIYTVVLRDTTEATLAKKTQDRLLDAVTQATEARGRLIRGVTHDVKNPLGAADGFAQLLEMGLKSELNVEQAALVTGVRRGIGSALRIITDMLDLSQPESSGLAVEPVSLDLTTLVMEMVENNRGAAEVAGHTLRFEAGHSPVQGDVMVRSDPVRISQVLGNLLSNAMKYTPPPGNILVWIEDDPRGVPPRPGEWMVVHVSDSGPGIPLSERENVFAEFRRLQTPSSSGGHGLGLAISRRIARLLGGDLTVDGDPGGGAVFSLWLPTEIDPGSAQPSDSPG